MPLKLERGNLLISYPYLEDDYFYRSVICMIEHNNEGSFGLIINKKMRHTLMKNNLRNFKLTIKKTIYDTDKIYKSF